MVRPVSISVNPNFDKNDIKLVNCLRKGNIVCGGATEKLKLEIENFFDGKKVIIMENGRSSLKLALKALGISRGDEVIIQAFTCSVVPMAILSLGAKVVYVDIDKFYNIDLNELKNKINKKTKAVVVQHTFGKPVDMCRLRRIVGNDIKIVEDLAHGLGNFYKGKNLGLWGDVAVLSFGRDKVISGVWGGAIVVNKEIEMIIKKMIKKFPKRNSIWIKKQLDYVWWSDLAMKFYGLGVGKLIHWWIKKSDWFDKPLSIEEKSGRMGTIYNGLPDELSFLILNQWVKLIFFIKRRKEIAKIYSRYLGGFFDRESSYLRYSIEMDNPYKLRLYAAKKNVFLGDWYDQVVAPKSVDVKVFGYQNGVCCKAEEKSRMVVNLPTNPNLTDKQVMKVIKVVKKWKLKK